MSVRTWRWLHQLTAGLLLVAVAVAIAHFVLDPGLHDTIAIPIVAGWVLRLVDRGHQRAEHRRDMLDAGDRGHQRAEHRRDMLDAGPFGRGGDRRPASGTVDPS